MLSSDSYGYLEMILVTTTYVTSSSNSNWSIREFNCQGGNNLTKGVMIGAEFFLNAEGNFYLYLKISNQMSSKVDLLNGKYRAKNVNTDLSSVEKF